MYKKLRNWYFSKNTHLLPIIPINRKKKYKDKQCWKQVYYYFIYFYKKESLFSHTLLPQDIISSLNHIFFGSDIPDTLVYLDGRHHYTHTINSHILATFQSPKVSIFSQFVMSLVKHRLKTG